MGGGSSCFCGHGKGSSVGKKAAAAERDTQCRARKGRDPLFPLAVDWDEEEEGMPRCLKRIEPELVAKLMISLPIVPWLWWCTVQGYAGVLSFIIAMMCLMCHGKR